jgi:hypothetical protein
MTQETKAKMSVSRMGHGTSLETRAKISVASMGRPYTGPEHETVETRAKISIALMGNKNGLGHSVSEKSRALMSAARIGCKTSPEGRAKMSVAKMGKPSGRLGTYASPESKAKMSVSHKGHVSWNKGIPMSSEARAKLSSAQTGKFGPLSSHWKGGTQISTAKGHAKRRILGFVPLNSPFLGCEAHHINKTDVIYVPYKLHHSVSHNQWTGKGMTAMNTLAGAFLTEDWT